jgi:polyisoprenoid-binding protein YceI
MFRRSLNAILAVVVLMAPMGSALAAEAAAAGPAEYELTRQYGSVLFRVFHQQLLNLVGRFDMYSGTLTLDPANLANSQLTATVNMASLNMGDADVTETLANSAVWFNSSTFPDATFKSTSATVTGENEVDFQGDLTFVGVTKPWTFHVKFNPGPSGEFGSAVGILGTGTLNRLDFGVKEYLNMAAENVEIEVNVKFNRK